LPAFEGHDIAFVTVESSYRVDVDFARFYVVVDATRWNKFRLVKLALQVLLILLRERPEVIISTGAAPGYFALRFGKFFRSRTIWIDSIANAERLSLSGEMVGKYADLWLTQWPHLSRHDGPHYIGSVL
jgi:UDP-N-acetylglucosamine:LPS N-acetylglucosamine transferase